MSLRHRFFLWNKKKSSSSSVCIALQQTPNPHFLYHIYIFTIIVLTLQLSSNRMIYHIQLPAIAKEVWTRRGATWNWDENFWKTSLKCLCEMNEGKKSSAMLVFYARIKVLIVLFVWEMRVVTPADRWTWDNI